MLASTCPCSLFVGRMRQGRHQHTPGTTRIHLDNSHTPPRFTTGAMAHGACGGMKGLHTCSNYPHQATQPQQPHLKAMPT